MRPRVLLSAAAAAGVLAGCSDAVLPSESSVGTPLPPAAELTLSRQGIRAAVGDTARLVAHVRTASGLDLGSAPIHWRVADPRIAGVEDGLIYPLAAGETQVIATSGAATAMAAVQAFGSVTPVSLSVTPDSLIVTKGSTLAASATLTYSNGIALTLRTSPVWRTLDPAIASVRSGKVVPVAAGTTQLIASVGTLSDTATVTVTNPLPTISFATDSVQVTSGSSVTLTPVLSNGARIESLGTPIWSSSNTAVATVSQSGVVTGVAGGSALIRVSAGGIESTARVFVTTSAPVPAPTAPVPPPPSSPLGVAVELPRVWVDVRMPAVTGRSIQVSSGDDLQAAINAAQPGDELVLQAGATFTGPFTLPRKAGASDAAWVTIRTSGALPAPGTRVTPAQAGQMPKLVSQYPTEPVLATAPGASHYRLIGLDVSVKAGATMAYTLVALGDAGQAQNTLAKQPHHLVLDRMYVHGTPTLNFQRCIALNSGETAIVDSWISECHGKGFDSQAIAGWNGTGPYKITNNRLEGAGENVMFGGADPQIPNALPSDIEIRRNHFFKPRSWQGVWSVKNLLELKIGQRILVEGNVFENNWADAQSGFAIVMKSTNQDGGAPWSTTSDVTFQYNIVRNSAHGVSLAEAPEFYPAVPAARMRFAHNIFERIGSDGDYAGGRMWQVSGIAGLTLEHNTGLGTSHGLIFANRPLANFVAVDNFFGQGALAITSDYGRGSVALAKLAPGAVFQGNVLVGALQKDGPAQGNYFAPSVTAVGFVNYNNGDLRLSPSSAYSTAGSGGTAVGADVAAVQQAVAGVIIP